MYVHYDIVILQIFQNMTPSQFDNILVFVHIQGDGRPLPSERLVTTIKCHVTSVCRGLPHYQATSCCIEPFGHNTWAKWSEV